MKKKLKTSFCVILGGMVLIHLFYLFYFNFLGSTIMTIYNAFSIIICLILLIIYLLKASDRLLYYALIINCIHAFLAVVAVGTDGGFEIFILCFAFAGYQLTGITKLSKKITNIIIVSSFLMLIGARFFPYWLDMSFIRIHTENRILDLIFVFNCAAAFGMAAVISMMHISKVKTDREILRQQNLRLSELASMDPLTHLLNRRAMKQKLAIALETKLNYGIGFTIAIVDVDDFKKINDTYGHDCGDMVLKKVVKTIMDNVRKTDCVSRWGGDEILILFNNTPMEGAMTKIRKIHKEVSDTTFIYDNEQIPVSITIGVCSSDNYVLYQDVIIEADRRLYYGKHNGKNQIVCENCNSDNSQTIFKERQNYIDG